MARRADRIVRTAAGAVGGLIASFIAGCANEGAPTGNPTGAPPKASSQSPQSSTELPNTTTTSPLAAALASSSAASSSEARSEASSEASSGANNAEVAGAEVAGAGANSTETNDAEGEGECGAEAAGALYTRRIAPLLAEDRPKSCNTCHLAGVDLGGFVRDDACESMACLVQNGLVDLNEPEQSTILAWISRAQPNTADTSPGVLSQAVIDEEYAGFLEWITFSKDCGERACPGASCGPRDGAPQCPNEPLVLAPAGVPSDCSDYAIETLFKDTVYAQRARCSPCHVDSENNAATGYPWIHVDGTCAQGALETLRDVDREGFMNLDDPAQSLLLQKPLADQVSHGGSEKFHDENDPTYKSFFAFIDYYAKCQRQ